MTISKQRKPIKSDEKLVLGVFCGTVFAMLAYLCILVYGIEKDVKSIKETLIEIEETLIEIDTILKPIEHIKDPVGLIQHMNSGRRYQMEYPEANFTTSTTIPDEPVIIIETNISSD